jgi:hypothetical protein
VTLSPGNGGRVQVLADGDLERVAQELKNML